MDSRYGGEAASYYGEQPNPPYHHDGNSAYPGSGPQHAGSGEDGERGLMGGLAGAAAGAYGGHKVGHGVIGAIGGAIAGHKLQDYVHDRKEKREEEERLQHQPHPGPPPPTYSPGPQYSSQPHHGGHHSSGHDRSIGSYAGNFTSSSDDIHLERGYEGGYELRADCRRRDGGRQTSSINLDKILGNENGRFTWVKGGSGAGSVTVQQGDTLMDISRRFNCRFDDLVSVNNISNPDMIYPGQNLQLPGRSSGNFGSTSRDVRLVENGRVLEAELKDLGGNWHRQRLNLDEYIGNEDGNLRLI